MAMGAGAVEDDAARRLDLNFPVLLLQCELLQILVMNNLQRDEPKENEQAPGERGARENPQPSCGQ